MWQVDIFMYGFWKKVFEGSPEESQLHYNFWKLGAPNHSAVRLTEVQYV